MGKAFWERAWVRHLAVALGYGILAALFRHLSYAEWSIATGLRLSVLLLVPYRYWPALIAGDSGYYIYLGYTCAPTWGATWGFACAVPPITFAAPALYWLRKRWPPVISNAAHIHIGRLLCSALVISVIAMLRDMSLFAVMKNLPSSYASNYYKFSLDYLIGGYLGALTVAPVAMLGYQKLVTRRWAELPKKIENSRLVFESLCMVLPVLALLLWIGFSAPAHTPARQMAQVAMFLPVVWLAFRHGWQGASVGGTLASCAVMLLMPAFRDPVTLQAESIVAFAISTMLLMGSRIGSLDKYAEQERLEVRAALALAQRNVYLGEMQLRMTSQALEQVKDTVQAGFTMMMGRLHHLQPAIDDRGYRRHAAVAQDQLHRLADSLYPITLRERGLPGALSDGGMAQILREAGLTYSCDLRGPLSKLSNNLRVIIYRVIWEAVADACTKKHVSNIRAYVRVAERRGRLGALIIVRFRSNPAQLAFVDWDELIPSIVRGTSGLGLKAVRDRAALFEGRTRIRSIDSGHQISVLLVDPAMPGIAISSTGQRADLSAVS